MLERVKTAIARYAIGELEADQLRATIQQEIAASPQTGVELQKLVDSLPAQMAERVRNALTEAPFDVAPAANAVGAPIACTDATRLRPLAERSTSQSAQHGGEPVAPLPTCSADPGPSSASGEPAVGSVLNGHYRIVRELGRGGMGVVFLAQNLLDDQPVAIKLLHANFRLDPDALGMLKEESRKGRALSHPNIVGIYPLERDGDNYYIPMEYLQGATLRELLDNDYVRGMSPAQAWPILRGVAAALEYAHDHGVIHSDLKPSNIFVTTGGRAKVLDFGIARALRAKANPSDSGTLCAITPAYASYEMLQGQEPDFTDDVYGLACVIYELLTGRHPYGELSAAEVLAKGSRAADVPNLEASQNEALRRGLAVLREDRTKSVEELMQQCEGAVVQPRHIVRPGGTFRPWLVAAVLAGGILATGAAAWLLRGTVALPVGGNTVRGTEKTQPAEGIQTKTQASERARLPGEAFHDCPSCPQMVVIPAGVLSMSSPIGEPGRGSNELQPREVRFERAFAMSKQPITRAQYRNFLDATGRVPEGACRDATGAATHPPTFADPGFAQTDQDPAVCVGAADAIAYAEWLNSVTGLSAYHVPTEAEWEYSARTGTHTAYAWGDREENACRFGNFADREFFRARHLRSPGGCSDGYPFTAPVGSFGANPWGLEDTVGNVRQWTVSCAEAASSASPEESSSWLNCAAKYRAIRGAGFATLLGRSWTRVAVRLPVPNKSLETTNDIGFRVARSL